MTRSAGTVNAGTVTFAVSQGGTAVGTAATSSTVSGGNASATFVLPGGTGAGGYTITATYNAGGNFATSSDATHTLNVVVSDLTLQKTHLGHFSQGQTDAAYTLTVSNIGNGPTNGSQVTVTDTLPSGLTATAISGLGWSCNVALVSSTRSDALTNGFSYSPITVTVTVAANAPASVTNVAAVSGGGELNTSNDGANDPTAINPVTDVSARVRVTQSGFGRNRTTGLWSTTMTVTNTGTTTLQGPIQVVLTSLTSGVTMTNNTGLRNGSPYITIVPAGQSLAAGAPVNVTIQFLNPSNGLINFTPVTNVGIY